MLTNYFNILLRNWWKDKVYVLINVLGLGVAIACCVVAWLNFRFSADYDQMHQHRDKVYRINTIRQINDERQEWSFVPVPMTEQMPSEVPGVEQVVRFHSLSVSLQTPDKTFGEKLFLTDAGFWEFFSFELAAGNKADLGKKQTLFLEHAIAVKYYRTPEAAVGQLVTVWVGDQPFAFTVAGVIAPYPKNTTMALPLLAHFDNLYDFGTLQRGDWGQFAYNAFIRLEDPAQLPGIAQALDRYLPQQQSSRQDWKAVGFRLQPFNTVPYEDIRGSILIEAPHPAATQGPAIMALLILLIACFNFTNTTIAFAGRRLKEIGIRKVMGSSRRQLIGQLLAESLGVCALAMLVGLAMAELLVPAYNQLWGYLDLKINYLDNLSLTFFLAVLLALVTLMAGYYPAVYITQYHPEAILRGKLKFGGSNRFTRLLLSLQFGFSLIAIVCGLAFTRNAAYQEAFDLGYDRRDLVVVPVKSGKEYAVLANAIQSLKDIEQVAGAKTHLGQSASRYVVQAEGREEEVYALAVGAQYLTTMGANFVAGRDFIAQSATDLAEAVVVNETFVRTFGWENPIGKRFLSDTLTLEVVGVVEDVYVRGLFRKIEPTIFKAFPEADYQYLVARTAPGMAVEVGANIEKTQQQTLPYMEYTGFLQEDILHNEKRANTSLIKVFGFLAISALLLSLSGLFALVSLNILKRTKEIGIRKVLGASAVSIVHLVNKGYLGVLLGGGFVGILGGYFTAESLMSLIWTYHAKPSVPTLGACLLLMFAAAALVVSVKVRQAALINPADTLRTE